jgi:hypothetical protein
MMLDGNADRKGTIDISALRDAVARQTEEDWNSDPFRQRKFAVHKDTHSISLIYDSDFRHEHATKRPKHAEFEVALRPIVARLAEIYDDRGEIVRCLLARLEPGGVIPAHVDTGFSLRHSHRVHIPIITHDRVRFIIDGEAVSMREGDIWEINNCRPHEVRNEGEMARVHLIVDWAPPMTAEERDEYDKSMQRAAAVVAAGGRLNYD